MQNAHRRPGSGQSPLCISFEPGLPCQKLNAICLPGAFSMGLSWINVTYLTSWPLENQLGSFHPPDGCISERSTTVLLTIASFLDMVYLNEGRSTSISWPRPSAHPSTQHRLEHSKHIVRAA
ncbi:hypothetical protein AC1031_014343 [Aphanomyces cochlioides]|nr:hypothetical protein AC1031_014343 [Aphanomyces cochlioides]